MGLLKLAVILIITLILLIAAVYFYWQGGETQKNANTLGKTYTSLLSSAPDKLNSTEEQEFENCINTNTVPAEIPSSDPTIEEMALIKPHLQQCFENAFGRDVSISCVEGAFAVEYAKRHFENEHELLIGLSTVGIHTAGTQNYAYAQEYQPKCEESLENIQPPSPEDLLSCENDDDCTVAYNNCNCALPLNKVSKIPSCDPNTPRCEYKGYIAKCVNKRCTITEDVSNP